MPSPFPGMDPFIEAQEWTDFHTAYMSVLRELLTPGLRPSYTARIERRVYVESQSVKDSIVPDITIVDSVGDGGRATSQRQTWGDAVATIEPIVCPLPQLIEHRESFLVIRNREDQRVVTVIELLSPANKRPGPGRDLYLEKRVEVLTSRTHLVELDLLRGGQRMPMAAPLPPGEYFALVCRSRSTNADVYAWQIEHRLPSIPIPLDQEIAELPLDLQKAFDLTFDRAAYGDTLDYSANLVPPLNEQIMKFVR